MFLINHKQIIDGIPIIVVKTINVGNRPAGVVVSNNGKRVYITNPESKDISVIDTKKLLNIKKGGE